MTEQKRGPGRPRKDAQKDVATENAAATLDEDALLKLLDSSPKLRARLAEGVKEQSLRPSGEWSRDYQRDRNLNVTGGKEVVHPEGFTPLPPSYIKKYVATDGSLTDHLTPQVKREVRMVPARDADNKPKVDAYGDQEYEEKVIETPIAPGAKMENGKPVKSEPYKKWLDLHMAGKNTSLDIRHDLGAENTQSSDPGMVAA